MTAAHSQCLVKGRFMIFALEDVSRFFPTPQSPFAFFQHAHLFGHETIFFYSFAATFPFFQRSAEPERFVSRFDDVRLVGQPVQHCLAKPRVGKHRGPFGKRQIRCYDYRRPLRTPGNHLKEQLCGRFRYRYVSHFIDHNEIKACPAVGNTIKLVLILGFDEFVYKARRWVTGPFSLSAGCNRQPVARWVFPVPASPRNKNRFTSLKISPSARLRIRAPVCAAPSQNRTLQGSSPSENGLLERVG